MFIKKTRFGCATIEYVLVIVVLFILNVKNAVTVSTMAQGSIKFRLQRLKRLVEFEFDNFMACV